MGRKKNILAKVIALKIIREFNVERNNVDPEQVMTGLHKVVWWVCDSGHQWEREIRIRSFFLLIDFSF
jgi:hypothetical protein